MTFRPEILEELARHGLRPDRTRQRRDCASRSTISIALRSEHCGTVAVQVSSRSTISPGTSWSCAAATSFFLFRSKTGPAIEPLTYRDANPQHFAASQVSSAAALPPTWADVQQTKAYAQEPLVAGGDEKIRLDRRQVKRHCANDCVRSSTKAAPAARHASPIVTRSRRRHWSNDSSRARPRGPAGQ